MGPRTDYHREWRQNNPEKMKIYAENRKSSQKRYRETHREELKIKKHQYYLNNKEKFDTKAKEYAKANPKVNRRIKRRLTYGLTHERFLVLLESQKFKCAICKINITEETLHVDHDHETNEVRGLLCQNCNFGLGRFKDDPHILYNAQKYLRHYGW